MLTRLLMTLLVAFLGAGAFAAAPDPIAETIVLRHVPAARMAERFEILTAGPAGAPPPNLRVTPAGPSNLLVSVYMGEGGEMERQRLLLLTREIVQSMDRRNAEVTVSVYAVQPKLLTDEEFVILDTRLREGPMDLRPGLTAKGIVYWTRQDGLDQEVLAIQDIQAAVSGQYLSGPVTAAGRVLPNVRPDGSFGLYAELTFETQEGVLIDGQSKVQTIGRAAQMGKRPVVLTGGESRPIVSAPPGVTVPPRHEFMVYIWMQPKNQP